MFRHGVLKEFEFETYNPELLEHFVNFQSRYSLIAVPLRALILAGLDMKNIKAMEKQLLFPKVFIKDMEAVLGALSLRDLSCDSAVRESVYRFGKGITAQALMLELAQDRVMNSYAPFALKLIQSWDVPDLPFDGRDLMATGIKQGAELGKTLSRIEDWWISQDFKPDKIACLNQV